jgi:uroporphyrinogen-III synthase
LNEKSLNEKPFERKIIENGFEPWVVPLIEISTIKPRSSIEKVSHTNFS